MTAHDVDPERSPHVLVESDYERARMLIVYDRSGSDGSLLWGTVELLPKGHEPVLYGAARRRDPHREGRLGQSSLHVLHVVRIEMPALEALAWYRAFPREPRLPPPGLGGADTAPSPLLSGDWTEAAPWPRFEHAPRDPALMRAIWNNTGGDFWHHALVRKGGVDLERLWTRSEQAVAAELLRVELGHELVRRRPRGRRGQADSHLGAIHLILHHPMLRHVAVEAVGEELRVSLDLLPGRTAEGLLLQVRFHGAGRTHAVRMTSPAACFPYESNVHEIWITCPLRGLIHHSKGIDLREGWQR